MTAMSINPAAGDGDVDGSLILEPVRDKLTGCPVFNSKPFNAPELLNVVGDERGFERQSMSGDQ